MSKANTAIQGCVEHYKDYHIRITRFVPKRESSPLMSAQVIAVPMDRVARAFYVNVEVGRDSHEVARDKAIGVAIKKVKRLVDGGEE